MEQPRKIKEFPLPSMVITRQDLEGFVENPEKLSVSDMEYIAMQMSEILTGEIWTTAKEYAVERLERKIRD